MLHKKVIYTKSKINEEKKKEFIFSPQNTEENFSGCPILTIDNHKIIGIIKTNKNSINENYASFIPPIFEFLNKEEIKGPNIEIKSTEDYYQGELINNIPNGRGIIYYKNGEFYIGNYNNGKKEGIGKYIDEYGNYYIGPFKNDKRNGKGVMYYNNGKILYEGDFIDDKYNGSCKYYFENGDYYIG